MRRFALLLVALSVACAPPRVSPAGPSHWQQLAEADALVRAGCFDCLQDALARYRRLAESSPDPRAAAGARDATGLLAIRERELGLIDLHNLEHARDGADEHTSLMLDVVETLPRRFAGTQRAADDLQVDALLRAGRNRQAWTGRLSTLAGTSLFAAATAIAFECARGDRTSSGIDALFAATAAMNDALLIRFARATCAGYDIPALEAVLRQEPRFVEINYFLGLAATMKGKLDTAERYYELAFDWRRDWPAVTIAIAHLAITAEDFDRAADFYQRTLAIVPASADARIGLTRARSFAGRYREAIAAATELLSAGRWYIGDVYYWRAWNEAQLEQNEQAWADVHEAARLIANADVPKLTGVLAIRREDLPTARAELQTAHERDARDCETSTLLGGTFLELRDWPAATSTLVDAVACLDRQDADLRAEIEHLRAGGRPARVLARREQTVDRDQRLRLQSFFNLAVAAFNTGDRANARMYAEKVLDDEHFGDRARQLLDRLKP